MSAIWGAIDFNGKEITDEVKTVLKNGFNECAIDKVTEISFGNVYMACGLQYFTAESKYEKLPSEDGGVFFTADVVLDNRDAICEKIGIKNTPDLPDGEIVRQCFNRYGKACLNDLLGAYVFVKYDSNTGTVDMVSDAIGNRFVYYFCEDGILFFSSLQVPLEKIKKEIKINEKWMAYYLGVDSLDIFEDAESTMTEGIYRIAPATHITFKNARIIYKNLYWDVTKIKRTRKPKTDEEYRNEFRTIFYNCVNDTLRTDEEVSIMLSGGYDSTSVACFAAPILKKRGKKLYSFTSAPLKEFVYEGKSYEEADETETVKRNMAHFGNVECAVVDLADIDIWDARKEYNAVTELPYKSPENMLWLYESYKEARKKGARLILSGAFGNGTVSYDNRMQYINWLFKSCKFVTLYKEINAFHKRYGSSMKFMIKDTLKKAFNPPIPKNLFEDEYKSSYAIESILDKNRIIDRIKADNMVAAKAFMSIKTNQDTFLFPINFRHYSEFPFKNSLRTGVLFRDPTRDKRMVEFAKTVPYNQYTHNGYSRRLIREYLEDIMPPDFFKRQPIGIQSADMRYRFLKQADRYYSEWRDIASNADGKGLIDTERLVKDLREKKMEDLGRNEIIRLFYTVSALEFIQKYKL